MTAMGSPSLPSVTCAAACVSDTARRLPAHCETMGVLSPGCQAVRCCQVICQAVRHCQALSGASVRPAVRCCQCCRVLSGACLTSEGLRSCRVLSELSGVAVRRCRSCQSCRAAAAVRRWAVAVRCCRVVLSGCCQALTHTSHTYDTIKRRPAGLYYTYSSLYSA